jgi:hypothetical protein
MPIWDIYNSLRQNLRNLRQKSFIEFALGEFQLYSIRCTPWTNMTKLL